MISLHNAEISPRHELAIATVIVDTGAEQNAQLHQLLLQQTMKGSTAWLLCAAAGPLTVRIDLTDKIGA